MTDQSRTPICDKEWQWATWNGDDFKAVPLDVAIPLELEAADLRERLAKAREEAIEECAKVCEQWGNDKVARLQGNEELVDSAKASAWDALQCAAAIRALNQKGSDHETLGN